MSDVHVLAVSVQIELKLDSPQLKKVKHFQILNLIGQ